MPIKANKYPHPLHDPAITVPNTILIKLQSTFNSLCINYNPAASVDWVGGLIMSSFVLVVSDVINSAAAGVWWATWWWWKSWGLGWKTLNNTGFCFR